MLVIAASAYEFVLAIHVMAVVLAFGVTFAYPVIFAVGARTDPRSLPLLHRIEYTVERWIVNPGLTVAVGAGIYLASDGHYWKSFFPQWGIGVALVIGGLVGAVTIPTSQKAEKVARRDIEASVATPGGSTGEIVFSDEYRALVRRLSIVGSSLSALVLLTILFMALKL